MLTSLFEEQLLWNLAPLMKDLSRGTDSYAESLGFLPDLDDYRMTNEIYLENLRKAREAVAIPIMASLNGATPGGWVRFAKEMEQAGAHAIELNTYALATDASHKSQDLEKQLLDLVKSVCDAVKIPVSVKLSQSFTSIPNLASQLQEAGAAGIVLFNRFYQPDFDIEALEVRTHPALLNTFGTVAAPPLGSHPLWAPQYRHRHYRWRALGRGCAEVHHGRRQLRHDGFGASYSRHRPHRPRTL